jgi:4-alpha-glucanotransferase
MMDRSAGILLHVTSLPGKYGMGDIGNQAYKFVDFLEKAGQSYWQILPLNPVHKKSGYSPYSPLSSLAGNSLLIDIDTMLDYSFVKKKFKAKEKFSDKAVVEYVKAEDFRQKVFEHTFAQFKEHADDQWQKEYQSFIVSESAWLDDFAMFISIKRMFNDEKWIHWPVEYRDRDEVTLLNFQKHHSDEIEKVKFLQFIFFRQWNDLKTYCNKRDIKIIGDIPIYISLDSADVWAFSDYFKLDDEKQMKHVAGVPPDYFNENGQLWNMPVFDWKKLKRNRYKWWMLRLHNNLQLYDVIRLDHFRGFSAYWEVPAGEQTAINGEWIPGPADDFFNAVKKEFPELPFIAEDLGEIDQPVYDLRDRFELPGMQVLQFAFYDDMPWSIHIPHNYKRNSVVYTGTHDNNTVLGWYKNESKSTKKRISDYTGRKISKKTINEVLIEVAYGSVARLAVVPLQDVIGLGEEAIMNRPSVNEGNWKWKLKNGQIRKDHHKYLAAIVKLYHR